MPTGTVYGQCVDRALSVTSKLNRKVRVGRGKLIRMAITLRNLDPEVDYPAIGLEVIFPPQVAVVKAKPVRASSRSKDRTRVTAQVDGATITWPAQPLGANTKRIYHLVGRVSKTAQCGDGPLVFQASAFQEATATGIFYCNKPANDVSVACGGGSLFVRAL